METVQYPGSGRVVRSCYDLAGRAQSVLNGAAGTGDAYAEVPVESVGGGVALPRYSALGGLEGLVLGGGKLRRDWEYNVRGQTTKMSMAHTPATGAAEKMRVDLGYVAGANKGNVDWQGITLGGGVWGATQNYSYDGVNRLRMAQEGANWKETYGFDGRGNRWVVDTAVGATWYDAVSGAYASSMLCWAQGAAN